MWSSYVTSSNVTKTFIRTARPIETEEVPFDVPKVQKDDGANCGAIGVTCQRANPCKNQSAEAGGKN